VAERYDSAEPADTLAESLGVTGAEREEARLWDGLIEDWRIVGPFSTDGMWSDSDTTPVEQALLAATGPVKMDGASWATANSKETLGFVELDRVFDMADIAPDQKLAYAMTRLESPDDREVTLSVGCANYLRVWVNGEDLLAYSAAGRSRPDQRRLRVQLRAGDNTVLVKTAGFRNHWQFCMGIVDGGDGVRVTNEDPPGVAITAQR